MLHSMQEEVLSELSSERCTPKVSIRIGGGSSDARPDWSDIRATSCRFARGVEKPCPTHVWESRCPKSSTMISSCSLTRRST
jgi:hypothetical protein